MNRVWLFRQLFHRGFISGCRYGLLFGAIYGSSQAMQFIVLRHISVKSDSIPFGILILIILLDGAMIGGSFGLLFGAAIGASLGLLSGFIAAGIAHHYHIPAFYYTLTLLLAISITGVSTALLCLILQTYYEYDFGFDLSHSTFFIENIIIPTTLSVIASWRASEQILGWYVRTAETHAGLEQGIANL